MAANTIEERFAGLCIGCESIVQNPFRLEPAQRLCSDPACNLRREWPQVQHSKLVSIVPDWRNGATDHRKLVAALPKLHGPASHDVFARWADSDSDLPACQPGLEARPDWTVVSRHLPYQNDFLRERCGLICGAPVCYRSKRLQAWLTHPNIFVLDLSTYLWSRTLKDPRSWAIINVAIERGIRNLAAWTAGNAGYSLALLARACNHYLSPVERLRIFALHDRHDSSMDKAVMQGLRRSDCHLLNVPSIRKEVLSPGQIQERVEATVRGMPFTGRADKYWDVTDGWDAVGLVMYRLLMAQVIRDLVPTHVVAPLGTGNLLLGILLAVRDCYKAGALGDSETLVVAAMPKGENIVQEIKDRKETEPRNMPPPTNGRSPCMPKIACTYTPLVACIDSLLGGTRLMTYETSLQDQKAAGQQLFLVGQGRRTVAEPSSLAPFAALPRLADDHLNDQDRERVLVVNSGFGITSAGENRLLEALGMLS